jgi:hypothetical protein
MKTIIDRQVERDERVEEYMRSAHDLLSDNMDQELESELMDNHFAEYYIIVTNIAAMIQKEDMRK